jgi:GAF domain-containing protein
VAAAGLPAATFDTLKQTTQPWEIYSAYLKPEFQTGSIFYIPREHALELYRPFDVFEIAKASEITGPDQWRQGDVLLVPIYGSSGEAVGLIHLDDPRDGRVPTRAAIESLKMFASPAALVIENARLLADTRERLTESQDRANQLEALSEVSYHITAVLREDEVIAVALEQLKRVVAEDRVTLYLKDKKSGQFRVTATRGLEVEAERLGMAAELLDRSLFAEIVANRRVLLVADVSLDARFPKSAVRKGAWLGVPLVSHGEVMGVLGLDKLEAGYYTPAHAPVALAYANHVAVTLENARLYQETVNRTTELTERTQRLALLQHASAQVIGALDADRALSTMVKEIAQAFTAESVLALVWGEGDEATLTRSNAERTERVSLEALDADGLVRRVRDSLTTLTLDSDTLARLGLWAGEGIKSAVALPMAVRETLVGVVVIGSRDVQRGFGVVELEVGETIAKQAAVMVNNAQLYYKGQQRLIELASIAQVSKALNSTIELQQLYEVIRSQVVGLTNAPDLALGLYDENRNELTFPLAIRAGQLVKLEPRVPGNVSQFIIQSQLSLLLIGDVKATLRGLGVPDLINRRGAWDAVEGKSYLGVPLVTDNRLVGTLQLAQAEQSNAFTTSHERVLIAVAPQIAIALENARRHEQIQRVARTVHEQVAQLQERATQLEALTQQRAAHNASLYEASLQQSDALSGRVQLLNEKTQHLEMFARVSNELNASLNSERILTITARALAQALKVETVYSLALTDGPQLAVRWPQPDESVREMPHAGDSVIDELRETSLPMLLTETARQAGWLGPEVKSALLVPLRASGKLVGLAAMGSTDQRRFAADEVELALALADEAALALNNARTYEKTLKRLVDLGSMTQTSRAVGGTVELNQLYDTVRVQVGSLVGARTMSLALYDEAKNEMTFPVLLKNGETQAIGPRMPGAVLWHIIQTQQPLRFSSDAEVQAQQRGFSLSENGSSNGVYGKSYLGVPLVSGTKTIGVLSVADTEKDGMFDAEHERVLVTLATQIASAIDNARIYEAAARRVEELEDRLYRLTVLNRTWGELSRTLEAKQVLDVALQEICQSLNPNWAVAVWWDELAPITTQFPTNENKLIVPPGLADPLVQWFHNHPTPLGVENLAEDELTQSANRAWLGEGATSALVLPLTVNDKVLGLIGLVSQAPRHFQTQELELAGALANQAAQAAQNAWHYDKTQRKLAEAASVGTISRALSRVADLAQLWAAVHTQVTALTGAETLTLQLYDEATSEVAVPLLVRQGEVISAEPQAPGALTRHILLSQRALLLNGDWKKKAKSLGIVVPSSGVGELVTGQSFLGVPLLVGERMTGVLVLADERINTFGGAQLALLESVSTQIALAVENARMFARTRDELVREQGRTEQARQASQSLERQLQAATQDLVDLRGRQEGYLREVSRFGFLINLSQMVSQAADEETALVQALALTGDALGADYGTVFVKEIAGDGLVQRAVYDPEGTHVVRHLTAQPGQGLIGSVYQSGQSSLIANLTQDERWLSLPLVEDAVYQSGLAAPLVAQAASVGAIVFLGKGVQAFDSADVTLIEAVARQLGLLTQHTGLLALQKQLQTQANTLLAQPTRVTPQPAYNSDSTLVTTVRKRAPEPLADFDVSADDLQEMPDDMASHPTESTLNPLLVIGLMAVFVVGGLALVLAVTGTFSRWFGSSEPTAVSVIVTNTVAPTFEAASATVVVQPSVAATVTAVPPTATETPLPTETPTELPTPTLSPTPGPTLPPGVIALGIIRVAEGTSARLRAAPNGDVVGSVPNGEQVQVLQGKDINGGVTWIQIRLNSGQVGWIADSLVEIITP